jgi:hypothetical protein
MIYRIYDQLAKYESELNRPDLDNWKSFRGALAALANEANFSKPIFEPCGQIGLYVRFEDHSDVWRLTYDEGDEFNLTIREFCEISNQVFEESFKYKFWYPRKKS